MPHMLPDLPYDYAALEPHIDAKTMEIHHTKHHQTYVDKLNAAVEGTDLADKAVEDLLTDIGSCPDNIKTAVRNHGGGHANHSLFWQVLSPDGGGEPSGALASAISEDFGSFKEFREKFTAAATGLFGSGWAWLVVEPTKKLALVTMPNQDSPLMERRVPILGLDVWEHAYYLKYRNRRPEYIEAFWNVVNWGEVGTRLGMATG
ncbi:MAG: superoxide dismutase [Actinomycetota bacterium]